MLLEIKNLTVAFKDYKKDLLALKDINFSIDKGEVLALVGESGCGKSLTSLAIMGLLPKKESIIKSGEILLEGKNLLSLSEKELCSIRGKDISIIFQEPMTALDPVFNIEKQISEVIEIHEYKNKTEIRNRVIELLNLVQIANPESILNKYPHELSGGMRQRVMIAIAIACNPKLLIADEPTTALDVTIQAEILDLLKGISKKLGMSIIFITHDLDVVCEIANKIAVMYGGRIVEEATVLDFFNAPLHPYSKGLILSKPDNVSEESRLYSIKGMVPNLSNMPSGCEFHPRCANCLDKCPLEVPKLKNFEKDHKVRCFLY